MSFLSSYSENFENFSFYIHSERTLTFILLTEMEYSDEVLYPRKENSYRIFLANAKHFGFLFLIKTYHFDIIGVMIGKRVFTLNEIDIMYVEILQ